MTYKINNSLHLALRYLFADVICSKKGTVFRERSSNKTVTILEDTECFLSNAPIESLTSPLTQLIGHFKVAWESGSRVLLNCPVGLFWGRATVYAVVYSARQNFMTLNII